jgi:hypothetical protein
MQGTTMGGEGDLGRIWRPNQEKATTEGTKVMLRATMKRFPPMIPSHTYLMKDAKRM